MPSQHKSRLPSSRCIYAAEAKRQREKPFHALDAIDCVTKALVLGKHRTPENVAIAEELLRRAIELEPHYGRAHSVLAEYLGREVLYGRKPRRSTVPLAFEAAQKAVLNMMLGPILHCVGHFQ